MSFRFPHERLEAWSAAMNARRETLRLIQSVPTGYGEDIRQLRRSSGAVPRLIAEGADRWAPGDKLRRFGEALGEAEHAVSSIRDLIHLDVLDPTRAEEVITRWSRVRALVLGLTRAVGGRAQP